MHPKACLPEARFKTDSTLDPLSRAWIWVEYTRYVEQPAIPVFREPAKDRADVIYGVEPETFPAP